MPKLHITSTTDVGAYDSDIGGGISQDAAKTINHSTPKYPPFAIGTITSTHMEIDQDEILVKSNETNRGTLNLNYNGGSVVIGHDLIVGRNVWTNETNIKCVGKAGTIYMWSAGATDGARGIYLQNSGGTVSNRLIGVNQNNRITDLAMLENIPVRYRHSADTSQYFDVIAIYQTNASTIRGHIGYHNTGDSTGALCLIPHTHAGTDSWSSTVGLYVGSTRLKWENKNILRYSATPTDARIVVADGTSGDVKTGSATIAGLFTALSWTAGTSAGPVLNVTVGGTAKTATIPSASSDASGIVTNANQTFGGVKTFSSIRLTNTTDAVGNSDAGTALIIGPRTGTHITMDNNEIIAKTNGTTIGTLYINETVSVSNVGDITAGRYLKSTYNGNTVTIGSQNTTWCHFTNSADIPFYFNKKIHAVGGFQVYNQANAQLITDRCTVYAANGVVGIHSSTNRGLYEFTDSKWIICLLNSDDTVHSSYKIYDAVWNDFAEFRSGDVTEGGYAVYDDGYGHMKLCTERMQPGTRVTSDTFGIAVGYADNAKTPIGVAGRVLVYPVQDRNNYHVGDAVCAAPGGKVDIMTREEIMMYPDRILGIVSEVPTYEVWNQRTKAEEEKEYTETNIPVNGRIWIYVR